MRLFVLCGFLGSGKTTVLMRMARELQAQGHRLAIVVNEIGEIGIDDALLKRVNDRVWSLFGGCICCSLAGGLVHSLRELAADHAPDVVLLESSGASHPDAIAQVLKHAADLPVTSVTWCAVVDPLRLEELLAVLEPLITAAVVIADEVYVTKTDLAGPEQLQCAREWIARVKPGVRVRQFGLGTPAQTVGAQTCTV